MSQKSLQVLQAVFAENSGLNLPVGVAEQVLEIRKWVEGELSKSNVVQAKE